MIQFEELQRQLDAHQEGLAALGESLALPRLREEVEMLEHKSADGWAARR